DKEGCPTFSSCKSPESFTPHALAICPPHTVIPVIFVPGIMGTNLRMTKGKKRAWSPPNGLLPGMGLALKSSVQKPESRQVAFNPNDTEVDPDGACSIPSNFYMLTESEAKKRGWGALHADSYHGTLQQLEIILNEQYSKPGRSEDDGNHMLAEIGMLMHLGSSAETDTKNGKPNYSKAAAKACKAWGQTPEPLNKAEIDKLDHYYYPVWAHGYNWLQSCEESAKSLLSKIDEVLAYYEKSPYFHCDGKVILVSHSLGGFVTRRAAQMSDANILGIVHGVQPVAGAPVVYRRFRAGTEVDSFYDLAGAGAAAVIGWSAADITPALSCAPGPLELLPTKHYPAGWLKFVQTSGGEEKQLLEPLPKSDPYEEIYGKTTDDCWWGMVDLSLIDPAGTISAKQEQTGVDSEGAYKIALLKAKQFHKTLDLYAHPKTYGYYGIDDKKYFTFGSIFWKTNDKIPTESEATLISSKDQWRNTTGKSKVSFGENKVANFKLANDKDLAGDGTVPLHSGAVLEKLSPTPLNVFKLSGFDHQMSYANKYALQSTVYSIAKLIQLAEPAKP
ncbi:triacylglycerol lipase, partial [Iodobacter sp.]|uniref:esterase/lipase family protein n=1 Tax=Iodobacter sp. TaxID=1915058 RepID=UPI0025E2BA1A